MSSRKPRSGYPGSIFPLASAVKWVPARAACGRLAGMTTPQNYRIAPQRESKLPVGTVGAAPVIRLDPLAFD